MLQLNGASAVAPDLAAGPQRSGCLKSGTESATCCAQALALALLPAGRS